MSGEVPGEGLGRKILHLTGEFADPLVGRFYTVLNGVVQPLAGETRGQRSLRDKRAEGQHCVLHQDQTIVTGRDDVGFSTAWDLRSFGDAQTASAWLSGYPQGIEEDFGVVLQPITEGDDLPGSDESHFSFFNRQRTDGMLEAALLGIARVDRTVAVMRVAAVGQPAAPAFVDWFFREGGRQTAAGGVTLMTREIDLLRASGAGPAEQNWGLMVPSELQYQP
jgi:hypothetical protein